MEATGRRRVNLEPADMDLAKLEHDVRAYCWLAQETPFANERGWC